VKTWARPAAFLLALSLLTGCAAIFSNDHMDSWMGHHKSELLMSWGPPTKVDSDGKGGEILSYIYDFRRSKVRKNAYTDDYEIVPTGYKTTRMFWVNKDGKIYYWREE